MGVPPGGSAAVPVLPGGSGPNSGMPFPNQQGGSPEEGQAIRVGAVVEVDAPYKDLFRHAMMDPRFPVPAPLLTRDRWGAVRLQNLKGAPLELQFTPLPAEKVPTVADASRPNPRKSSRTSPAKNPPRTSSRNWRSTR